MIPDDVRRRAVEAAYAAHADDVYRLAYALMGDTDEAADVTEDAFVRAFERWHRYDAARSLRPWLNVGILVDDPPPAGVEHLLGRADDGVFEVTASAEHTDQDAVQTTGLR